MSAKLSHPRSQGLTRLACKHRLPEAWLKAALLEITTDLHFQPVLRGALNRLTPRHGVPASRYSLSHAPRRDLLGTMGSLAHPGPSARAARWQGIEGIRANVMLDHIWASSLERAAEEIASLP